MPGEPEKQVRNVDIFVAEAAPPDPRRKFRLGVAGIVTVYLLHGGCAWNSASSFRTAISAVPAESAGNDAERIADNVVALAKRRGIKLRKDQVQVEVGPDSALGPMVTVDARYGRFLLPAARIHAEIRSPYTHPRGRWDGVTLTPHP